MNKRLILAAAVASLVAAVPAANAATSSQGFNVTVALTSSCTAGTIGDVAFTYTSFQAGNATASSGFNVTCTNSLGYTMALDANSGTVAGLNYTLAGIPGATQTGTGAAQAYTISGTMAGGQSGTCATAGGACSGTQGHTLTITY